MNHARRQWLAVLREANGQSTDLPADLAARLAAAKKELDTAVDATQQANAHLQAQLKNPH